MRSLFLFLLFGMLIGVSSCRTDFETVASTGELRFSKDTVYLDTVFTNIGSSTYQLKVYNKSKKDINIPTIQFENGHNSKYRMTVDGRSDNNGKQFSNITLLAQDSLYIFIETTAAIVDADPTTFLYTDKIVFDSGANEQVVDLVTLIQDAVFLYPSKNSDGSKETITINNEQVEGFYLNENDPINGNELLFTNQKPYVIYGYAAVPENKMVIFEAGSRVFFHANSGLYIGKNASLNVNGSVSSTKILENEVIFEGDRLEPDYSDVPGQWGRVWLAEGSVSSSINHLTVKNAAEGLYIQSNYQSTTSIQNTQIYNCVNYGIWAENTKIIGANIAINNSGKANLSCTFGGNYKFTHCTFNNNWNSSKQTSVAISNAKTTSLNETNDLIQATFNNCIIYGSYSDELVLTNNGNSTFNYKFNNCLIKSTNQEITTDAIHFENCSTNQDPKFYNVKKNDLNIDKNSSAFAKGNSAYLIPIDIIGNSRTLPPDLGAYQNVAFPEKK